MFNKFIALFSMMILQCCLVCAAEVHSKGGVKWYTNYDEAVKQAKSTSQPLLMFFTGSDWCGWCNKIDEEAFDTKDFADTSGNKFVFLKLDFPLYAAQDPQLKAQNKQLQQKFDVRSFPTVILYDVQKNQQIGTTGYRAGGGRQYGNFLNQMHNDYSSRNQRMGFLGGNQPALALILPLSLFLSRWRTPQSAS